MGRENHMLEAVWTGLAHSPCCPAPTAVPWEGAASHSALGSSVLSSPVSAFREPWLT